MNIYVSPTPEITDETKVHTIEFPIQGYNQWDEEWEVGGFNRTTGEKQTDTGKIRSKNFISVKPSTNYYICFPSGKSGSVLYYDRSKDFISIIDIAASERTTPQNCYYMMFAMFNSYGTTYNNDISINYPATETDYYPYKGRTVYSGTLTVNEDGTGQIVATMASVDLGTYTWVKDSVNGRWYKNSIPTYASTGANNKCSIYKNDVAVVGNPTGIDNAIYSHKSSNNIFIVDRTKWNAMTEQEFKSALSGVQFVYVLATPVTINLTVEQIETLIGFNYVWNNVGTTNITFQYYTGGEGMAITFLDCWTYPKAKLDEMFKAVDDRLDALEEAAENSNAKTTTIEPKEIATEPVAEREGDE